MDVCNHQRLRHDCLKVDSKYRTLYSILSYSLRLAVHSKVGFMFHIIQTKQRTIVCMSNLYYGIRSGFFKPVFQQYSNSNDYFYVQVVGENDDIYCLIHPVSRRKDKNSVYTRNDDIYFLLFAFIFLHSAVRKLIIVPHRAWLPGNQKKENVRQLLQSATPPQWERPQ